MTVDGPPALNGGVCIGDLRVTELDADLIADHLDAYAASPKQRYAGRDENGQAVLKVLWPRKPATINRMVANRPEAGAPPAPWFEIPMPCAMVACRLQHELVE